MEAQVRVQALGFGDLELQALGVWRSSAEQRVLQAEVSEVREWNRPRPGVSHMGPRHGDPGCRRWGGSGADDREDWQAVVVNLHGTAGGGGSGGAQKPGKGRWWLGPCARG